MSLQELNNPTRVGPKKSNISEAQGKDFKVAITNILMDLKGNMNKSII